MTSGMVAVLCARRDSIYGAFGGVTVFDEVRDCRTYAGVDPVVAHPPCRGWGRLRHVAKVQPGELDLARFCLAAVRRWGGVLEHPAGSRLWIDAGLPVPDPEKPVDNSVDEFGFSLVVNQSWWGHRAPKNTWLYVAGLNPDRLPLFPIDRGDPGGRVDLMSRAEREATPVRFAMWLVDLARRCSPCA